MNEGIFPSTLRETRSDLTKRPVIIGMLALGLILGISGPFDTLQLMTALPRMAYWITVVALTFAGGTFVSTLVHKALGNRATWLAIGVSIFAVGVTVVGILTVVNLVTFDLWPTTWSDVFNQLAIVTLISAVVEISSFAVGTPTATQTTKLLERLPYDKRGPLIALSAEDHYVRVTTTKGVALILVRLSDALGEVGDNTGLQIHRSHWVAMDHIKHVTRTGDRGEVTLRDGTTRPISRGYLPAVRAAGLLPRKGRS